MIEVNKIHQGHILKLIKEIDDESIDCCVTSPPYYGLRSYKTEPQIWGGKEDCQHEWADEIKLKKCGKPTQAKGIFEGRNLDGIQTGQELIQGNFCINCGAWRGELGLEPTYELYLEHLWMVFAEIKRVLKKTGTCFVNLGDSYGGSGGSTGHTSETKNLGRKTFDYGAYPTMASTSQYQQKSLLQIPSRFAIGMTDRGWILRNEIIWYKRNCMPSSAKDRFTVDFEKVFFFVKNKKYWFEQQLEPISEATIIRNEHPHNGGGPYAMNRERKPGEFGNELLGRNKRCVWDIPPTPFSDAHFAVFPQELIEPMIKAGCPEDGLIFDPFIGSGTTGIVARKLNRNYIGIELQPEYIKIAEKRFHKELGLFNV